MRDKSVALVGSAASLLRQDFAQQIDSHDIVIRMNLSIPGIQPVEKVGKKTDVWCIAKDFFGWRTPDGTRVVLFMKRTRLGDEHWKIVRDHRANAIRWPQDLEDEVKQFVGADPGTGIRLLYWLKRIAQPSKVSVFGMDCWDTPSSWSGPPAIAHNPTLEKLAMKKLLAVTSQT